MKLPEEMDFAGEEIDQDPYPVYAEMRQTCPVGYSNVKGGYWYLSKYEDVYSAFRDADTFSSAQIRIPYYGDPHGKEIPLQIDDPEHGAWRRVIDPIFTATRMRQYEPEIRKHARSLIAKFADLPSCEFVSAFSIPFPTQIFCMLMGLPPEELAQFQEWETKLINPQEDEDFAEQFKEAKEGAQRALADLVLRRRREGATGDDAVSILLRSEYEGRPLTDDELTNICGLLFIAGLDTVTQAISSMISYLAEHPAHRQALVDDPSLIPDAVEELLRYDSLIALGRLVVKDTTVRDQTIRAGDRVLLLPGSAGRDETVFENPDEVDFARSPNRHLAFGTGPHRCAGSHLARLELRITLDELHKAMPVYEIEPGEQVKRKAALARATTYLPLKIG
jgi:cytochrome P450